MLAAVGGVLLTGYVSGADKRAMAGMEATSVLVVLEPIAKGTAAESLTELVSVEKLPAVAVAPSAVSDLESLAGMVATTDLQPGEQVLAGRFADPTSLIPTGEVAVPAGLQRLSLLVTPDRVVGGRIAAGDKVGIYVSLTEPKRTHVIQHKVLVVRVQGGVAPAAADGTAAGPEPVLEGDVMVTLAVDSAEAEEIIFGLEHGSVWLTIQPDDVKTDGTRVVTDALAEPEESVFE
jgi:pilus assembly protein CpaB